MDLNKVMIIGRLVKDPESKTTPNGQAVCAFSVATNHSYTDAQGQKQDKAEYHNIVAWRKLAEICGQYLKKGSKVYLEGRITTRSWKAQDGQTKYRTEITADNLIMLDSKEQGSASKPLNVTEKVAQEEEIRLEDIPF